MAVFMTPKPDIWWAVRHGLKYLRSVHLNPHTGGYAWLIRDGQPVDNTNYCYGLAFVLLAYASAAKAGIVKAQEYVHETFALMEQHFWLPEDGLYADEATADWQIVSAYLDRAALLAHNICVRQTQTTNGYIWEHYSTDWKVDWDYNKEDPQNLFRPWGYQAGHFTE